MIIDTSAWIDFSRLSKGPLTAAVIRELYNESAMTTEIIRLELLVGLSKDSARTTARVLARCQFVSQNAFFDVDDAVELFQMCRRAGDAIRSPNDCLIAAIAIREGVPVLHNDRDFDVLARHTVLEAVRS